MEESSQQIERDREPSFWTSVILGAVIFGIISAAASLIASYSAINTGSQTGWISSVICILIGFAGMLSVWHYVNEYEVVVTLGRAALIGFLAGCLAQLIGIGIVELWKVIDPHYAQAMKHLQMAVINNKAQLSDAAREKALSFANNPLYIFIGYVFSVLFVGIMGLITAMIGAKLFSPEKADEI